jgi:hypothetical protein
MSNPVRSAAEERIEQALLERWDPLSVAFAPGEHPEYHGYAHELYNLLARGASDTQIARYLHQAEVGPLGHPELATRDLAPLLALLRTIERQM